MIRILKNEVDGWNRLATWLRNIPTKDLVELKHIFQEEGGPKGFVEKAIKDLISDIKKGDVSLKDFTLADADKFKSFLECTAIDQELLRDLAHHIYGGDERNRYFKK